MGTKDRRKKEYIQREKAILKAAEKMVCDKGPEGLNIRDVAKLTHLSKGTIYLYFKNKDELIGKILVNTFSELIKSLKNIRKEGKKSGEYAWELFDIYLNFAKKYHQKFRAMHESFHRICCNQHLKESKVLIELIGVKEQMFSIFNQTIVEGVKDGSFRKDIDPMLSTIVIGMITESFMDHLFTEDMSKFKKMGKNVTIDDLINQYKLLITKSFEAEKK